MKIRTLEIAAIAAAAAPRFDMYVGIHKDLRPMMTDALLALGRMDPDDAEELTEVSTRVLALPEFCIGHLSHENKHVHPALEARCSGSSSRIAHEHEEHERHIARLSAETMAISEPTPEVA